MKLTITFIIFFFATFFLMGYMHEAVHQNIFEDYGIESEINMIKNAPSITTTAEEPCPEKECILAHNINDAIGYHVLIFFIGIMVGLLIIIMIKEGEIIMKKLN